MVGVDQVFAVFSAKFGLVAGMSGTAAGFL
jgi:hypothetical protein